MSKLLFSQTELDFIQKYGTQLKSDILAAVLKRSLSSVRVKLSKLKIKFDPNSLKENQAPDKVSVTLEDGKYIVAVKDFKGALKIVVF